MTFKTVLVAIAFTALPALASAGCAWSHQQAQSCAQGLTWDADSRSCVEQVTS